MPSLSQLRLRAERMKHKVIELQSDLRCIERRIRILESRAVGGNSRSVSRDLENAQVEQTGILDNIAEAQQALHNLEELIKLHDGQMASFEASGRRSLSSTPSKKSSGRSQRYRAAEPPATVPEKSGTPAKQARKPSLVAQNQQTKGEASTCRATRCTPNLTTDNVCSTSTCTVATSTTFLPRSPTKLALAPCDPADPPVRSFAASSEALYKPAIARDEPSAQHLFGGKHFNQDTASPSRAPTSPLSPAIPPACFHLPLPPQPHVLSPQPSNLSSPAASPRRHTMLPSPTMSGPKPPAGRMWTCSPDPAAAVQSWLAQQQDQNGSLASPASVHSLPIHTASPQHVYAMPPQAGQPLPTSYHPQTLYPVMPLPAQSAWYHSPCEGIAQPDSTPQATYIFPVQDHHSQSPLFVPSLQQQTPPAAPTAVSATAADVSKVESWLRAVGRARGWDLKLLDDLLAQDLAAVLASDCPQGETSTAAVDAQSTPMAPMHARSNPLALQQFVSECAGRPRSGGRVAGTADTLVNAVHKHLLRRSGTPAAHQHADLMRQSFDLLECGAASATGHTHGPASLRQNVFVHSTAGSKRGSRGHPASGDEQGQSKRSESFPGFQQAGDVPRPPKPIEEQCMTSMSGNGDAQTWNEKPCQEAIADTQREVQQTARAARGQDAVMMNDAAGAACGIQERSRRKRGSGRGSRNCGMPGQLQLDTNLATHTRSEVGAVEGDNVWWPVSPWKGVQVASSKKVMRGKAPHTREETHLGSVKEDEAAVPSPGRTDSPVRCTLQDGTHLKHHRHAAASAGTSPLAAALRASGIAADTDIPLVKLARRVTVHSHRLELTMGEVAEAFHTTPRALRWLTSFVGLALPFRRKPRDACSASPAVPLQASAPQPSGCPSAMGQAAQCGHVEPPHEEGADPDHSAKIEMVRRVPSALP